MKRVLLVVLSLVAAFPGASAQSIAHRRADGIGLGMNLSYLENWWLGTKEKHYSDFAKPEEAAKRKKMFADIAGAGFTTVRIPINFGAWASVAPPHKWENSEALKTADLFVKWALENRLRTIIDLHHVEFDGKIPGAATTERIVWLWRQIAQRYKNTDPKRVFFELRNEPHDIPAEEWRAQAQDIIKAVRQIAPKHTLIIGFHDWNSRAAMVASEPFSDKNIIYTFHYYDPFIFTHQGATWSAEGLADLKDVPFPASAAKIQVPQKAIGTWIENQINDYKRDSRAEKMFSDLQAAKQWSKKNNVPIFLGEFGSYSKHPPMEDRCRHAEVIYLALRKLSIPNAWWEWDAGFSMFEKGTTKISDCMLRTINEYRSHPGPIK